MIRAAVLGADGRMGQRVRAAIAEEPRIELAAAIDRGDLDGALRGAQVYIDFTSPDGTRDALNAAIRHGVAAVIGTTGLDADARAAMDAAAGHIPIVYAANFSLGVTVLAGLVEKAARVLPDEFDIEIVEAHHKHKKDAPSGTAYALGHAAARGRDVELADVQVLDRSAATSERRPGDIGFQALRGGDVVGEHTVMFLGPHERIEITHRATSRAIFARGAVRAALWIVGQKPGIYSMADVLGL